MANSPDYHKPKPEWTESEKKAANTFESMTGKSLDVFRSLSNHVTDFDPPYYNVWKQQKKSEGSNHYGNSESRWLDNLLYLYTKPFDTVIDPFAGGFYF